MSQDLGENDKMLEKDWLDIVEITYNVVSEQNSKGRQFERCLSRTLNIGETYRVIYLLLMITIFEQLYL